MKQLSVFAGLCALLLGFSSLALPQLTLLSINTVDSLGACQGVSIQNQNIYLYGDREVGVIRTYNVNERNELAQVASEIKLTKQGQDVINHPTGIAYAVNHPTFIGNSIRLNAAGTAWRALIYCVDWDGLQRTHTLDGNLLATIEDDACIQGTRPEYVTYKGKSYVATADYGNRSNQVRLYDPISLQRASKTSNSGVLAYTFRCSPWVQNLHWIPEKRVLVLIQNQIEGRKWRFTFLDLDKSIETGQEQVINVVNTDDTDELEGMALLNDSTALAVSSSRQRNMHLFRLHW